MLFPYRQPRTEAASLNIVAAGVRGGGHYKKQKHSLQNFYTSSQEL